MKVRWRQHEIILVTILLGILVFHYLYDITEWQIHDHPPAFNYYYKFLLPQFGFALFIYACYLWINLVILPLLRRDIAHQKGYEFLKTWMIIVLQVLLISFLLGPCLNFVLFYTNWFNVGAFVYSHISLQIFKVDTSIADFFGNRPQRFSNFFGGFDISLGIVLIYLLFIYFREAVIYYIERSAYNVLIANRLTAMLVAYFSISAFLLLFYPLNYSLYVVYNGYIPSALLVYLGNTYWLFPLKFQGSFFKWRFIVYLLFSSLVCTLIGFAYILAFTNYPVGIFLFFLKVWACQLIIVTPVSWIYYQQQKDKILKLLGMEKELIKSKADLQFLRSQINPHFLFNALNTLYGTALLEGSKNTAAGIQKLGDMMRFMLHENNQDFITMDKEIEFLENYIDLQKLRTQVSPDIIIEDNIAVQDCSYQIAPMLLIPFIENAFKHGVSLTERSWIKIKLECDDNNIRFETRNSLHGYVNSDPEKEHSGIGLQNVKERLLLLYPGKHQFIYGEEGNEFVIKLSIQL